MSNTNATTMDTAVKEEKKISFGKKAIYVCAGLIGLVILLNLFSAKTDITTPINILDQYVVEDFTVNLSHKWYMPWTDQIVRFSGDKLTGYLSPTDGKFDYTFTNKDGMKLNHQGVTNMSLTQNLDPGTKIGFDGCGISGYIKLPNSEQSEVATLHMRVDINYLMKANQM